MYSGFDPNSIDTDAALQAADETAQYIEDEEKERALREQQANQLAMEEEQAKAAQKDPRNKEGGGGFKGVVKEVQSAIGGGLQDTASSLVTLPERAIDMFSGEMVEEGKTEEGYGAEWDDWFVDDANPIETKTWWGSALRSLTHFGTMAAAIIPAASAAGVGAATTVVGGLVRGAAIGALSDLGSKYSQEDNGLAILRDRFNFIDTPLSTKDTDHPAMKTLKNVVEGMGIGAVFDGASILIGKGVRKVRPGIGGNGALDNFTQTIENAGKDSQTPAASYGGIIVEWAEDGSEKAFHLQHLDLLEDNQLTEIGLTRSQVEKLTAKQKLTILKDNFYTVKNALPPGEYTLDAIDPRLQKQARSFLKNDPDISFSKDGEGLLTISADGVADEVAKAETRATSVKSQKIEKAKEQLQTPGYGAYKNEPISDPWQAAPTSNGKPFDVQQQLSRTRKEWGAEMGSTDSLTTPVQLERTAMSSGMAEDHLKEVMGEFMTDARVQAEIAAAKKAGRSLKDVWGESIETAQKIFEGRNTSDLTPDEFWAELNKGKTVLGKGTPDEMEIISSSNVVAADLVIGSLLREMRDMGIAGRELFDIADVADIDGPAKAMYDKIIAGLTQVKLSKMTQSAEFASLGAGKTRKKAIHEAVDAQVQESIDGFRLALKVAGNDPDDGLFRAIFETISMTNEIQNLTDFDNWIRKKLKGGEFNGKAKTGLLIKELQGVMIHSVLSGPKTSVRAIMGTGTATFLRPLSTALGATLSGDAATKRSSLAAMNAIIESIPEAWTLFKTKLNSYWSGDIAQVNSRFAEYTKGDEQWAMFGDWIENSGRANLGDKAAYYLANMARSMNDNKFLTYSTKIMAATDDTFGYLLSRAKGRERAMREAMTLLNKGEVTEITPQLLKEAEDRFLGEILDADGNITDAATLFAKKEATLTTDLTGFAKGLNDVFEAHPWSKPFFLFARTGVNGLALTAKHTPGFNFIIKEFNDIAQASPNNLQNVLKYGIETAEELANAKALQNGRLAIGSGVITMSIASFMSGNLTGNGPTDRKQRQLWIDAGYQPRSIKIGDVWVGYDSFEPFNLILSTIADVGDHSQLMGEEWTEKQFLKTAVVMAQGVSSKSYLAGMQQFVDLFAGQPGQAERIVAGLLNNQIPLSSLRNELGKLFNPHMKELNAGISDAIRNRNLITEHLATDEVPTKYDMLNGRPIRDWDFPTRMFNMFSPFSINLDQGPGRKLLFDSKYDLRLSTYSSPDGVDLSKSARVRSLYQKAIGDQNLELKLDKLATDPKILNSIAEMQADLAAGRREMDPMKAYFHNKKIKLLFDKARKQAWANIKHLPEVQELIEQKLELDLQNIRSLNETTRVQQELEPVLNLYK